MAQLVFDEAHIPLIAKGYHRSLEDIYQVHSVPMQLVLLSATLPPSFIPELFDAYNLLPDTVIVRQSTNRPELIYVLEKIGTSSLLPRTIAILDEEKQDWNKEDRGLVFVTSIAEGQKLVDLTDHAFYVGDQTKMSDTDGYKGTRGSWLLPLPSVLAMTICMYGLSYTWTSCLTCLTSVKVKVEQEGMGT